MGDLLMKKILIVMLYFVLPAVSFATNKQESIEKVKNKFSEMRGLVFQEVRFIKEQLKLDVPPVSAICYSAGLLGERLFQLSQQSHLLTNNEGEILENLESFFEKVYDIKYYSIDSFCGVSIGVQGNVTSEKMKTNKANILEYFSELSTSYEEIINH